MLLHLVKYRAEVRQSQHDRQLEGVPQERVDEHSHEAEQQRRDEKGRERLDGGREDGSHQCQAGSAETSYRLKQPPAADIRADELAPI